eukprot:TRINITY_DN6121_c0_g1_i1.p1 TRINITY_DN6121_c0_g1~~TRINITY_DN6121_c0_g1_i1.p1  ORF type:complete len:261 (-),score=46.84 TRINITY_DN6121_c0_g1_i1:27-809(-)
MASSGSSGLPSAQLNQWNVNASAGQQVPTSNIPLQAAVPLQVQNNQLPPQAQPPTQTPTLHQTGINYSQDTVPTRAAPPVAPAQGPSVAVPSYQYQANQQYYNQPSYQVTIPPVAPDQTQPLASLKVTAPPVAPDQTQPVASVKVTAPPVSSLKVTAPPVAPDQTQTVAAAQITPVTPAKPTSSSAKEPPVAPDETPLKPVVSSQNESTNDSVKPSTKTEKQLETPVKPSSIQSNTVENPVKPANNIKQKEKVPTAWPLV